jgi:hypothetical protein
LETFYPFYPCDDIIHVRSVFFLLLIGPFSSGTKSAAVFWFSTVLLIPCEEISYKCRGATKG